MEIIPEECHALVSGGIIRLVLRLEIFKGAGK